MLISQQDVQLYYKLHRALMFYVNQRLQVIQDNLATAEDFSTLLPEIQLKVRNAFLAHLDLIEPFVDENPGHLSEDELDIVRSWRHLATGKFYVFRELAKYTVFLSTEKQPVAYGVLALSQPFEDFIGPFLPVMVKAVLLPFKGQVIYDGILNFYRITFGPGIRRSLNDDFKEAKARHGIVTSLPLAEKPSELPVEAAKAKPRPKTRSPKDQTADVAQVIIGLIDQFCKDHLNEEYAVLCRSLAEKLARKRSSPLVSGKPNTWACGIVRTIGWVNFLDDRSQKPHMKLPVIDEAFGVGQSTGQGKSMLIRKMLKIGQFDPEWSLPSRIDKSPMAWMIQFNGFIVDARFLKREFQEEALRKGLIPYIPERPQASKKVERNDA